MTRPQNQPAVSNGTKEQRLKQGYPSERHEYRNRIEMVAKAIPAVTPIKQKSRQHPNKSGLYHAHLNLDGACDGYERHMRRGSAARSVYGYLQAILKTYPNPLGYVFPSKRRIQTHSFKWIRITRKKWTMSDENYSRRQIYSTLRLLTEIGAIIPSQNGWLVRSHDFWTERVNGVCLIRHLERVLREARSRKRMPVAESHELLAPVLPRNARTRATVLEDALHRRSGGRT
jgi:hypothetical protein